MTTNLVKLYRLPDFLDEGPVVLTGLSPLESHWFSNEVECVSVNREIAKDFISQAGICFGDPGVEQDQHLGLFAEFTGIGYQVTQGVVLRIKCAVCE